jgi:hypothetical protein
MLEANARKIVPFIIEQPSFIPKDTLKRIYVCSFEVDEIEAIEDLEAASMITSTICNYVSSNPRDEF